MYRYYILRNRGIMKHYFAAHGAYRPVRFFLGTVLTFGKEIVRLAVVERALTRTSIGKLFDGIRDGRAIARDDRTWKPMPPLEPVAVA